MSHLTYTLPTGDDKPAIAEIVLANPPQNRLTAQLIDELGDAVTQIARSDARAVLLRAEGPDFSFGGDFTLWGDMTARELRATFDRYLDVYNRFEQLPVPVIAAVQGLCFGGGFELALRADVVFAGQSARFGHPEQTLGITTLLGGIYRVAERAGRARAFEWALTSEQVPAQVMADTGVINRVVPDDQLFATAEDFARQVASGATQAHAAHKALLRSWALGGIASADRDLFDLSVPLFATQDVRTGLESAAAALRAGKPRPAVDFHGR